MMQKLSHRTELAYVAGYGRSGSTLLDIVVGNLPGYIGLGEVHSLPRRLERGSATCSCGHPLPDCAFWGELTSDLLQLERREVGRVASQGWLMLLGFLLRCRRASSARIQSFDAKILQAARLRGVGIVDSSKTSHGTVARPIILSFGTHTHLNLIHIVRDPKGVYGSLLRGDNQKLEFGEEATVSFPLIRASIGWLLANLGAEVLRLHFGAERYLRIRFEDLLAEPEREIAKIAAFLDRDARALIENVRAGRPLRTGHIIGGNRMARRTSIVFEKKQSVPRPLRMLERVVIALLCWPLMWRYRYPL